MIKINMPSKDYFAELKAGKTIEIGVKFAENADFNLLSDDRLVVAYGNDEKLFDEFDVCVRRVIDVPRIRIKLLHRVTEQKLQEELEKKQLEIWEDTNKKLDKVLEAN